MDGLSTAESGRTDATTRELLPSARTGRRPVTSTSSDGNGLSILVSMLLTTGPSTAEFGRANATTSRPMLSVRRKESFVDPTTTDGNGLTLLPPQLLPPPLVTSRKLIQSLLSPLMKSRRLIQSLLSPLVKSRRLIQLLLPHQEMTLLLLSRMLLSHQRIRRISLSSRRTIPLSLSPKLIRTLSSNQPDYQSLFHTSIRSVPPTKLTQASQSVSEDTETVNALRDRTCTRLLNAFSTRTSSRESNSSESGRSMPPRSRLLSISITLSSPDFIPSCSGVTRERK